MDNYKKIKLLRWSVWIGFVFLASLLALIPHYLSFDVHEKLKNISFWLFIMRCILYAIALFAWPRLMILLANRYQWSEEHLDYVMNLRYKVFIGFMIAELLFSQNILGYVVSFFMK